jgi:hypothetical protein
MPRLPDSGQAGREHTPRRCGTWRLLADSWYPGRTLGVHFPCGAKRCPDCGPAIQARQLDHFHSYMDGYPIRRRTIAVAARRAAVAKHRRAGRSWLAIPAPKGMLALYATGGPGEPVADLKAGLAADLAAAPVAQRIVSSRDWALEPKAERGRGRYQVLGQVRTSAGQLREAAEAAHAYRGTIPAESLPPGWDAALVLQQPDDATDPAWRRFTRTIGLRYALAAERAEYGL